LVFTAALTPKAVARHEDRDGDVSKGAEDDAAFRSHDTSQAQGHHHLVLPLWSDLLELTNGDRGEELVCDVDVETAHGVIEAHQDLIDLVPRHVVGRDSHRGHEGGTARTVELTNVTATDLATGTVGVGDTCRARALEQAARHRDAA